MTRYKFRDTARAAAVVATNAPARRTVVDVISEASARAPLIRVWPGAPQSETS